jgi:multidrug efflux pump subunit AcrA (membrane-fusion protein)
VERLKAQYDNTRVVSSIAGKVTSVSVYEGRPVEAYKAAFVVADETKIEITAEPASGVLDKLTEGMEAAIILSAYPGKELKGKIYLLPYPYGSGGGSTDSTSAAAGQDKLSHIEFDPQDLKLQTGDLVKVLVTLQRKDDALWLPPAAIRTFAGRKFVVVEEEGRQRRVDITVGIDSAERVEIKEGLQENQIVVGQ